MFPSQQHDSAEQQGMEHMTTFNFDDSNIRWHTLGDFENFVYSVLGIDEQNSIIDVIFKFEPNKQIVLHRHKALNKTFVVQGEHRFYEADGRLKEICCAGTYTSRPASNDPHRECGGDEGTVVLFSIRANGAEKEVILYEILDDEQNTIGTLSIQDFIDLYAENNKLEKRE